MTGRPDEGHERGERPPSAEEREGRMWKRLKAGLCVELGLADPAAARRWQDAVQGDAFDPDRSADEILARSGVSPGEPLLLERTGTLQRDLLMAPLAAAAERRARRAQSELLGRLAGQALALAVYTAIVLGALLLLRLRGTSVDGLLDAVLGAS